MSWELGAEELAPRGSVWPNGWYQGTVSEAGPDAKQNGTQLFARFDDITTLDGEKRVANGDGSVFNIGERPFFVREWFDHSNEQSVQIGRRNVMALLLATGNAEEVEVDGKKRIRTELDSIEAIAEAIAGKRVAFKVAQQKRTRKLGDGTKEVQVDEEGKEIVDVRAVAFKAL